MFDFHHRWAAGLSYTDFLNRYGTPDQRHRWQAQHQRIQLTEAQVALLKSFKRNMLVQVVAGAWCGDCVEQCPIFDHFAAANSLIEVRYYDRDADSDIAAELAVCGGNRVPAVAFLAEDGAMCGRYGDRTLSKYRDLAGKLQGAACSLTLPGVVDPVLASVTQDWLDEFERIQWILRLSTRLRQKHLD